MLNSALLRRVKNIQREVEGKKAKRQEMLLTAEKVSAEKIKKIYDFHQKKIREREEEIPVIAMGIKAELEIMENSEPQRLREIFLDIKGSIALIEKRLDESSEQFELYQARREEEIRNLEERKKEILQDRDQYSRQQVTEL